MIKKSKLNKKKLSNAQGFLRSKKILTKDEIPNKNIGCDRQNRFYL